MQNQQTHLLLALDAIHQDSGEDQLGLVDNFVVRDADGCPKITGSELHGAIRHYVARYAARFKGNFIRCAGQVQPDPHHDQNCPICWTFGRPPAEDAPESGHKGRVSIYDARIFFFPVNTMYGLRYVTTSHLLNELGISTQLRIPDSLECPSVYHKTKLTINLGKMMFYKDRMETCQVQSPLTFQNINPNFTRFLFDELYIVDETSFVSIVNANLDVQTNVSIDPDEGTVISPFVSESIPRGTIFGLDLVWETDGFPVNASTSWQNAFQVVETGLKLIEVLGVAGRNTRGMGRLKWLLQ